MAASSKPNLRHVTSAPRRGAGARVALLAVVVAGAVLMLLASTRAPVAQPRTAAPAAAPAAPAPAPAIDVRSIVHREDTRVPAPVVARPAIVPADYVPREHDYGADPDPFVRQPHDYRDTPQRLGDKNGYVLYDLERVQDMVRRGSEPGSELARVRGPLSAAERAEARAALQSFFDEATTVVDAVLDGVVAPDDAYRGYFRDRRRQLNDELRRALGLSQEQFYRLWPHIELFDQNLSQIDAIADLPDDRA